MAALVAIGIVAVLIVVGLYLVSRDGGNPESDSSYAAGASTTPATATSTSADNSEEERDPASRGRCADDALEVRVRPAAANFAAGSEVLLYAEITNTGQTPCDRDLVGAPLSFEVYRLDDNSRVWSSTDCTKLDGEDKVDFVPNEPVLRQIEWSGRVSQPGACEQRDRLPAEAGSYQVYALVGDVFSPAATFNLTEPTQ